MHPGSMEEALVHLVMVTLLSLHCGLLQTHHSLVTMNSLWMDVTSFVTYSFKVLGTVLETVGAQWIWYVTFPREKCKTI